MYVHRLAFLSQAASAGSVIHARLRSLDGVRFSLTPPSLVPCQPPRSTSLSPITLPLTSDALCRHHTCWHPPTSLAFFPSPFFQIQMYFKAVLYKSLNLGWRNGGMPRTSLILPCSSLHLLSHWHSMRRRQIMAVGEQHLLLVNETCVVRVLLTEVSGLRAPPPSVSPPPLLRLSSHLIERPRSNPHFSPTLPIFALSASPVPPLQSHGTARCDVLEC
jgi:hypothetical protein